MTPSSDPAADDDDLHSSSECRLETKSSQPAPGDAKSSKASESRTDASAESAIAAGASSRIDVFGHGRMPRCVGREEGAGIGSSDKGDDDDDDDDDEEAEEEEEGDDDDDDDEDEDDDEDDEEPRLKYVRLTPSLNGLYRNGDATSYFLVGGDKMVAGTHNGNIHVLQIPTLTPLRVYHAHSASVTSISLSPFPPPLPTERSGVDPRTQQAQPLAQTRSDASPARATRRLKEPALIPRTHSNDIYIASSSTDGNVCVQSLLDVKDVHLRNFARPVQAVALSPDFKSDRTYLSGGLAGQLILSSSVGQGRSTSTTTGTAVAAASGWLGSMGIGASGGKDTVLHSGEGTISSIKWSLSGKYVAWLNEYGIKIMRSKHQLETADSEGAWQRIGHYDRPQTDDWEAMAGVWKGRVEWIDERAVEHDDSQVPGGNGEGGRAHSVMAVGSSKVSLERLLVGWGDKIWIIHVHHADSSAGRRGHERPFGRAEVAKILRMDCIISGISLYTQSTLLVLAFCPPEEDEDGGSTQQATTAASKPIANEPLGGIRRRQNNEPPELRLIDLDSEMEVSKDILDMSRYERLGAADYHLSILPAHSAASAVASRGALETLAGFGNDMWNAAINPISLFSSGASIRSRDSGDDAASVSLTGSTAGTIRRGLARPPGLSAMHSSLTKPGLKIFMHSPYDCILGTRRDLADHLSWLVAREQYSQAWELLEENPDIVAPEKFADATPATTTRRPALSDDFFDGDSSLDSVQQNAQSYAEREKRRIGELWIQQLVEDEDWRLAGEVCGKVLTAPERWEKWVWTFAGAKRFDEITPFIPTKLMHPPLPATIYEVVLGHYIQTSKPRFKELLDLWSTDFFDVSTIAMTLENQLRFRDVQPDSVEDGEKGRDWSIVMDSLARLYEAGGRHREALKCYVKLHDADSVFRLIRDRHLAEAVADDIPSFIGLRVSTTKPEQMKLKELAEATSEAITLLVDEAQHGLVRPSVVVEQLQAKGLHSYLYFYLRGLWRGQGIREHSAENVDRLIMESQSLLDAYADLAVHLFAKYDRPLLMEFLKSSTSYTFEKAVQECEALSYYDELVHLYSKTGNMKQALELIIDRLRDVHKAIEFAKEQDDPDLWKDVLDYSMDKPSFIRALLEQVGTAINPITLVQRIPEGLEIQGLRDGLTHMMKEHELQHSISSGVAKVLRSELADAQNDLRAGQKRGIKFHVVLPGDDDPDNNAKPKNGAVAAGSEKSGVTDGAVNGSQPSGGGGGRVPQPGRCASCHEVFTEYEVDTILGFACGHTFHVSHLLELLHPGKNNTGIDQGRDPIATGRRSVGLKVMRARLLRDEIGPGCPVCI